MNRINSLIQEFRIEAERLYGQRLRNIILYGSWARSEAKEDSDIDLAVVLEGEVKPGGEIYRMIDLITELNLKYKGGGVGLSSVRGELFFAK